MIGFWVTGIAVSAIGLVLARFIPPLLTQPVLKIISYLLGTALVFSGLAVMVFGMKRKSQEQKAKEVI